MGRKTRCKRAELEPPRARQKHTSISGRQAEERDGIVERAGAHLPRNLEMINEVAAELFQLGAQKVVNALPVNNAISPLSAKHTTNKITSNNNQYILDGAFDRHSGTQHKQKKCM
jgi:hypothetical protein